MNNKNAGDTHSIFFTNSKNNLVEVKTQSLFFRKYRKRDALILLLSILVILLSGGILMVCLLYSKYNQSVHICDSENCMRIAVSLKESMDTSIDPCDDFYKYTCGKWPETHSSVELGNEYSWFKERNIKVSTRIRDLLLKNFTDKDVPLSVLKAKTLFAKCMDIETRKKLGLKPLLDILKELNLPLTPATISKNTTDFVLQMAKVKRVLWIDMFFGTYVYNNPKDHYKKILVLDLPDTVNPFPSDKALEKRLKIIKTNNGPFIKASDDSDEATTPFLSPEKIYMSKVIQHIVNNGTKDCKSNESFPTVSKLEIQNTVKKLFRLTEKFYELTNAYKNQTDDYEDIQDSDYMLIEDLQQITDDYIKSINESLQPKIIWEPFLQELLEDIGGFDLQQKILVPRLNYFKELSVILASTDNELLETAIWWTVVDYCVPHSSEELRKIWDSYIDELNGPTTDLSWSILCAENVNELMGMAVSWLYIDPSNINESSIDKVNEMLENIKSSFSNFIVEMDWIDMQTKVATLEKNKRMKSILAYPDWLFNKEKLDFYYAEINISDNSYFKNMVEIIRKRNVKEIKELIDDETDEKLYWPMQPTEVNALYVFQENQIGVPAGILQFPFYGLGLEALNYGALGSILGHELTHGFDDSGRRFDSNGNLKQWWSDETISNYVNKTICFINQYNKYYITETGSYINGQLTLGENIADNGGLREAYQAYQMWKRKHKHESFLPGFTHLTHDQLLFLSYAHMWCESYNYRGLSMMLQDAHCPGNIRLKMVLRNSKQFSKTWNCPVGSNMNPKEKCQLW